MDRRFSRIVRIVVVFLVALALAGCAQMGRARKVDRPGFLGEDFDKLERGDDDDWMLVYRKPDVDLAAYHSLILEPVTLWRDETNDQIDPKDRQTLVDNFYALLHQAASKYFKMVHQPGEGTLRFRVALTNADASSPTMDTVSSVVPQMRLLTSLGGYASGKPAFTGQAAMVFKVKDSMTGEILVMGADKRVGTKTISGSTDRWSDVDTAMQFWSNLLSYRICVETGRSGCEKPSMPRGF